MNEPSQQDYSYDDSGPPTQDPPGHDDAQQPPTGPDIYEASELSK